VITQPLVDGCVEFFVALSEAVLFLASADARILRIADAEGVEFCVVLDCLLLATPCGSGVFIQKGLALLFIVNDRVCANQTHECLIPGHQTSVYSFL